MINFDSIANKIDQSARLSEDDAAFLFSSTDLMTLGQLANQVNKKKNQGQVFFNINRHINPTNICVMDCKFCAYSKKPGEDGAYAYNLDEIIVKAGEAVAQGATEVHMVGGLHPRWGLDHYLDILRNLKSHFPDLHLKAFTAVELNWLAKRSRKSLEQVFSELREAGLGSLPGGGAEIFHQDIRDKICAKLTADEWLGTHRLAHSLGMKSNCTMLYGHIESHAHRIDHMARLRQLQDETNGFNAFIPLSFQPHNNEMRIDRYTLGVEDLKTIAIARLFLDNFQHIKAYWIMLGQDIAQLALDFGANDLDGTVTEEKISRMAGGRSGMALSRHELESIIKLTGRIPVERDTLYNPIGNPLSERKSSLNDQLTLNPKEFNPAECTPEMLQEVFSATTLHSLAQMAQNVSNHSTPGVVSFAWCQSLSLDPNIPRSMLQQALDQSQMAAQSGATVLSLDLCVYEQNHHQALSSDIVFAIASAIKKRHPTLKFVLQGVQVIKDWQLLRSQTPSRIMMQIMNAGIDELQQSPTSLDLWSNDMIIAAHHLGLAIEIKISLDGSLELGTNLAHWQSQLKAMKKIMPLSSDNVSVSLIVNPSAFVTPYEYLKTLALTKMGLPHIRKISSPLVHLQTISFDQGEGSKNTQHAVEKIAAMTLACGSSDWGLIPLGWTTAKSLKEEAESISFTPQEQYGRWGSSITSPPRSEVGVGGLP